jgi:hypothetical protein
MNAAPRLVAVAVFAAVSLGAVATPALAQRVLPKPDAAPTLPPPLPGDTIDRLLPPTDRDSVRAAVEHVVARKLNHPVPVEIAEPKALRVVIERSLRASQPNGKFEERQFDQLALRQIAMYDPTTKSIFIGSGGLATVGDSQRPAVIRMLLAQAFVQAVLDQELSLREFTAADSAEAAITRRMLSEGLAVTARDRAAQRLGIDPFAASYRSYLPGMFEGGGAATLERTVYGTGRIVVEGRWNAKGIEGVWQLLATKPTDVRTIAATIPRSKAIRLIQAALEHDFSAKEWVRARAPAAPSIEIASMRGVIPEQRSSLIERCLATETLGYTRSAISGSGTVPGGAALFSTLRMKDDESAEWMDQTLERMPAALAAEFSQRGMRVDVSRSTREVLGSTIEVVTLSQVSHGDDVPPTLFCRLRVGRELLVVTITNVVVQPEVLSKALEVAVANLGAESEFKADSEAAPASP